MNDDLVRSSPQPDTLQMPHLPHLPQPQSRCPPDARAAPTQVQPARGFGAHPHREMEIVTYVVEGELTHQDSMGTKESLGRGSIQFMTAGTGVSHSEHNVDPTKPLRFIQMWLVPRERGLNPNYGRSAAVRAPPPPPPPPPLGFGL